MRLLVDLGRLAGAERALLAVARAAGEMTSYGDEEPNGSAAGGPQSLQDLVHEVVKAFVQCWSHGMELVAGDAGTLASVLHAAASGGPGPGAAGGPSGGPGNDPGTREALQVTLTEDADRVGILATWLTSCAEEAAESLDGMKALDLEAWSGEGAKAFAEAIGTLSSRLGKGVAAFREAASTLRACAAVLWEAQLRARQAGAAGTSLYESEGVDSEASPEFEGGVGVSTLEALEDSRAAVQDAVDRVVIRLRQAAELAPRGPGSPYAAGTSTGTAGTGGEHGAGSYAGFAGAGLGGVWRSVWGLGVFAFDVVPAYELIDPAGYVEQAKGLADDLLDRGPHPVAFPNGTSAWSTWLSHRTRAFGQLLPPRPEPAPLPAEPEVDDAESMSVEQAGQVEPTSLEQAGQVEPTSVEQAGEVELASVEQAGEVELASVEQAGQVEPTSVEQAGQVEPTSVEQAGQVEPTSVEQAGQVELASVEQAGQVELASVEQAGQVEPTSVEQADEADEETAEVFGPSAFEALGTVRIAKPPELEFPGAPYASAAPDTPDADADLPSAPPQDAFEINPPTGLPGAEVPEPIVSPAGRDLELRNEQAPEPVPYPDDQLEPRDEQPLVPMASSKVQDIDTPPEAGPAKVAAGDIQDLEPGTEVPGAIASPDDQDVTRRQEPEPVGIQDVELDEEAELAPTAAPAGVAESEDSVASTGPEIVEDASEIATPEAEGPGVLLPVSEDHEAEEPEDHAPALMDPEAEGPGAPDRESPADGARAPESSFAENGGREDERLIWARGASSGRRFEPGSAGGPERHLTASRVRVTPRGVAVVERHVGRFGPDEVDAAMVGRLRRIAAGELGATPTDRNFCVHQLRAFVRYRRLGHATGDPGYEVWNNAHTAALEDYGMREGPHVLYPVGDTTTDYELAVLRAIGSGQAPVRWYKIEQRLSVMPIEERDYLPDALDHLGSRGLVRRGDSGDAFELTPAGREHLDSQGD